VFSGSWVYVLGFRVKGFGLRVEGPGFRVQVLGLVFRRRVGFRVSGLGALFLGLWPGFTVWGLGFRNSCLLFTV
jgi:hypothetical protein